MSTDYTESRHHELRKARLLMVDGRLVNNQRSVDAAASARVHEGGYWGFASSAEVSGDRTLLDRARRNARSMSRFGTRSAAALPIDAHVGEHDLRGATPLTSAQAIERLAALDAWCRTRYPGLASVRLLAQEERHDKRLHTSTGSRCRSVIARGTLHVTMTASARDGAPVELTETWSCAGSLADLALDAETLAPQLDRLHAHLQAKCDPVPARGGEHVVVLAPRLAGMLAHEAMGHPCEADIVIGGAVTRELVGQRVASELVTMVDFAHSWNGRRVLMPVYVDDEGVPARDAVLIERGVLKDFMTSRETAARLGRPVTGSARAYGPHDEPLVRMRNTVILPGTSRLDEMIAGVDDGYLLLATGNGQADSTTEFMFGVTLAYEIRGGRLGRAVRDTTVSGSALHMLQTVDAVSDDMHWEAAGYCGKKQPMVVSMGGPALRARAHLGGE